MVALGTLPTDPAIRATPFSKTRGMLTIDVYSSTSKLYTTCTPPKTYKRGISPKMEVTRTYGIPPIDLSVKVY